MARKTYQVAFAIGGKIGSGFASSFGKANNAIASVNKEIRSLNKAQSDLKNFEKLRGGLGDTELQLKKTKAEISSSEKKIKGYSSSTAALNIKFKESQKSIKSLNGRVLAYKTQLSKLNTETEEGAKKAKKYRDKLAEYEPELKKAKNKHAELKKEMNGVKEETSKLIASNQKAKKQYSALNSKLNTQREKLQASRKELGKQGVSVANLGKSYKKLEKDIDGATKKKERFAKAATMKEVGTGMASAGKKRVGKSAVAGAALFIPVKMAMDAEDAFADVKKVMDFKDKAEEDAYKKELQNLITKKNIALSLNELYAMGASAGQAGIAKGDVSGFVADAARMAIAFDMSREGSADMMFTWKNAFGMGREQLGDLTDQINYLSDTTSAKAPALANFVTRIGAIGKNSGFAVSQTAAIGASLLSVGMGAEDASTGLKNILKGLTAGDMVTKNQETAYKMLGFDPKKIASDMQKDAEGTLTTVFKKIQSLDKTQQVNVLKGLFGSESGTQKAASSLLQTVDSLGGNFDKVRDKINYAGSALKEFENRNSTANNSVKISMASLAIAADSIGQDFIPYVVKGAEKVAELSGAFTEWKRENPELASTIFKVAGGLIAANAAVGIGQIGFGKLISLGGGLYKNWGTVVGIGGKITGVLGAVSGGIVKMGIAMLASPLTWYVAAIAGVVGAGVLLYKNWDKISAKAKELGMDIKEFMQPALDWLIGKWEKAASLGKKAFEIAGAIKNKAGNAKDNVVGFFKGLVPQFAEGGVVSSPTLAMVGEGRYSESIIPHDGGSKRSVSLWQKAGEALGMTSDNVPGSITPGGTLQVTYAPVIHANDAAGVEQVLNKDKTDFERVLRDIERDKRRRGHGR